MKLKNIIKIKDWEKENFSKKEIEETEMKVRYKLATRKLIELRKKKGLTQEQLANISGIPRTTITKIETGYQNVSIKKIIDLANSMDMNMEINFVERKY